MWTRLPPEPHLSRSAGFERIKLYAQRNETVTKTVSKQFWNCFVSVSFRCADSLKLKHTVSRGSERPGQGSATPPLPP